MTERDARWSGVGGVGWPGGAGFGGAGRGLVGWRGVGRDRPRHGTAVHGRAGLGRMG